MQRTHTAIIILLICLTLGELAEIEYQTVAAGDYIKQYAIVQKINPSGSYVSGLCTDCTCKITIRDTTNTAIITAQPMTQLDSGLFGYMNNPGLLSENMNYMTFANCTSALYGWGIAIGQLEQTKTAPIGVMAENFTASSGQCEILNVGCHLNNIYAGMVSLSDSIRAIPKAIIDAANKMLTNSTDGTLMTIFKGLIKIIIGLAASVIKMLTDPQRWFIEDFMPALIGGIQMVILQIFIPLALIESFIIGHALLSVANTSGRARFFSFITTYINDHINIIRMIVGFIWNIHVAALDLLIKLVSIAKP